MATVYSFEELAVWQKAQELGMIVYALTEENTKIAKDFSFKDEIKRAALAIGWANWKFYQILKTKG